MKQLHLLKVPALLALVALVSCGGSSSDPSKASAPPPVPVAVAQAVRSEVPIIIRTIGSVQARAAVMLRPQVAGRIESLAVGDGVEVAQDQVLLHLDARPFQAVVREVEAQLASQRASAEDARRLVARLEAAAGSMSERELEQARACAATADAEVGVAQARLETAKLNLSYADIRAPLAGRIGEWMVKPGSIVKENEADLVQIIQLDPIDVAFSVPEERLPEIKAANAKSPLVVEALPRGEPETAEPARGALWFIDSKVDPATGSIRLKASYANADRRLWPGRFTAVSIVLGTDTDAVIIPELAVQPAQSGPSVFVVKPDNTVEMRPVSVKRTVDGKSVIDRGLQAGETVVTEGQLRLGPGARVEIKSRAGDAASAVATPAPAGGAATP